ncbi:MAG: hypothetical protein K9M94_15330 [Spirochaetia bacterium]|nr:hypothetical protein [Spirochaetia bacterium]
MSLQQTYCVYNNTLLPVKVAELQLQRALGDLGADATPSAEAIYSHSYPHHSPEALYTAVQKLLESAGQKGIEHEFDSKEIEELLKKLIHTRENGSTEYRLKIYHTNPPVLFIC